MQHENTGIVLVVDEEAANPGGLFEQLEQAGFTVLIAEDGTGALKRVERHRPDIVLLNARLPDIDGFELCRRLKTQEGMADVPVIFLSELVDTAHKLQDLGLNAVDSMTKPFEAEEVVARIHKHLTIRNLQKQLEERNVQLEQEIRERKRIEHALQESETRYQQLVELSPNLIAIHQDGIFRYINDAGMRLLEAARPEHVIGQPVASFVIPSRRKESRQRIERLLQQKQKSPLYEQTILRLDGEERVIEVVGVPCMHQGKPAVQITGHDITERKQTEDALREGEHAYRTLAENMPGIVYRVMCQEDGRMVFFNDVVTAMTGYRPEEMTHGKICSIKSYIHPEDRDRITTAVKRAVNDKTAFHVEYRFTHKNGDIRHFSERGTPVFDSDGSLLSIDGIIFDITERKQREIHHDHLDRVNQIIIGAQEVEPMLNDLLDALLDIFECDRAWLLYPCDLNTAAYRVPIERTQPEWPGALIQDIAIPLDPVTADTFRDALASDDPRPYDRVSGRKITREIIEQFHVLSQMLMSIRPKTGKPWLLGMHQCSYERIWSSEEQQLFKQIGRRISDGLNSLLIFRELRESEERYRLLFESANDPILVHPLSSPTKSGFFIQVNDIACQLLEYSRDELLQCTFRKFLSEEGVATLQRKRTRLIAEKHLLFEEVVITRTGKRIPVEIHSRLFDLDGQPTILAILRDMTKHKQVEDTLRQAKDAALEAQRAAEAAQRTSEAANHAKSEFLANMSHELRTPLHAILGYAQLLRHNANLTTKQQESITTIHRSGEHLLELINDILDLSKIEAGKLELQSETFSLESSLRTIIEMFRMRAVQKKIDFVPEFAPDLPTLVIGDHKRLRQILLNLLSNAVKFTERGSVTLEVTKVTKVTKVEGDNLKSQISNLKFKISDTGIGIPPDRLGEIFEPFHQVGERRFQIEGTGLGLAISARIVRTMGGELRVKSTPGAGSCFWFEIPFPVVEGDTDASAEPRSAIVGFVGEHRKIMIVDDNDDNRAVLADWLRSFDFEVAETAIGYDVPALAATFQPDLIFMDLFMPDPDGFTVTRQLKQTPELRHIPVIAFSAGVWEDVRQRSLAAGCNDFLAKPFQEDALVRLLERYLSGYFKYDTSPDEARNITSGDNICFPMLRMALQRAVDVLDVEECVKVIREVRRYDSSLAQTLTTMLKNYQFDELQAFLEQETRHPQMAAAEFNMAAALAALREDVRQALEQSAIQGDTDGIDGLVEKIRQEDAALANALAAIADEFDYGKIVSALHNVKGRVL